MSDSFIIGVAVLCVGLIVCVGSLYVLLKQKIVVNDRGDRVSAIDVPFFGKLQTNYPSLIGVFLGIALSFSVLMKWPATPDTFPLKASITIVEDGIPSSTITEDGVISSQRRDVFIGVALPDHYRFERVLPNNVHEVEFPIIVPFGGSGGHLAVAYTVTGVDEFGYAQRIIEVGNITRLQENGHAHFEATLRLPTVVGSKP